MPGRTDALLRLGVSVLVVLLVVGIEQRAEHFLEVAFDVDGIVHVPLGVTFHALKATPLP